MDGDLRQADEWGHYLSSQGWKIEELKHQKSNTKVYVRKLPLIGSVVKIQRPAITPSIGEVDKIARKHRAICVKLEPLSAAHYSLLTINGFVPDSAPSLATKEITVNLTPPLEEIVANLPTDSARTRRSIEEGQHNGVEVRCLEGKKTSASDGMLREFHRLLSQTSLRQNFFAPSFDQLKAEISAFGPKAALFLAYALPSHSITPVSNRPLAGALVLIHGKTAYYHHAASAKDGQRLCAPYLMMWEIIKRAKSLGLTTLNLGGVYDSRYHRQTRHWRKFSVFKKKFGGAVEYPPPLIKCYHPLPRIIAQIGSGI